MKFSLASVVLVLFLWVIGIITVFYMIDDTNYTTPQGSRWFQLMHSFTRSVAALRGSATLMPQQLPHSDHASTLDPNDHQMYIYFLWHDEDAYFNIYHYLSIESIFAVYPHAIFTYLVPEAPSSLSTDTIHSLKLSRYLASNKFEKYRKLGYRFTVRTFTPAQDGRFRTVCANCTVPFHISLQFALQEIHRTGGLVLHPSFYFLAALDGLDYGHYFDNYCLSPHESANTLRTYRPKVYDRWPELICTVSSMIYTRHAYDTVVECVLSLFTSDDLFLVCLESDQHFGGAICIDKVFNQCMKRSGDGRFNVFSALNVEDANNVAVGGDSRVMPSTTFPSSEDSKRPAHQRLSVEVLESFNNDPLKAARELRFERNWTLREESRVLYMGMLSFPRSKHLPDDDRGGPFADNSMIRSAIEQSRSIRKAEAGLLRYRPLAAHSSANNQSTAFSPPLALLKDESPGECHGYARELILPSHLPYSHDHVAHQVPTAQALRVLHSTSLYQFSCAPSIFVGGFPYSHASTLYDALTEHPLVLAPQCGHASWSESYVSVAATRDRAQCYPLIEPGERFLSVDGNLMLGVSPFAPHLIRQDNPAAKVIFVIRHPVHRLYLHYWHTLRHAIPRLSFDELVWPVISDPFSALSRLRELIVHGASSDQILAAFYEPSPRMTASSSPLTHSASAISANSSSLHAHSSLQPDPPHSSSLSSATPPLHPPTSTNSSVSRAVQTAFRQSLYALVLQHYLNVLGSKQILLMPAEAITSESTAVLLRSLGLVSLRSYMRMTVQRMHESAQADVRTFEEIPMDMRMSQDMFCKLTTYFRPFNDLLVNLSWSFNISSTVVDQNFTALWDSSPDTRNHNGLWIQSRLWDSLPEFAYSNHNQSWSRLWFEEEPEEEGSKLLPQLLVPQR